MTLVKILIVDDEPVNLLAISHNLKMAVKNMGINPETLDDRLHMASDGEQAIEMFKDQAENDIPYPLIFMDCSMEPMNGYDASI